MTCVPVGPARPLPGHTSPVRTPPAHGTDAHDTDAGPAVDLVRGPLGGEGRVLVLGSSGRIGTMLRRAWARDAEDVRKAGITFTFQTRHIQPEHPDDLLWDVLHAPPPTDAGPFECMIVLSGIVPRGGADFTLNTAIGTACVAAAAQMGIPAVLLASTSAVYGTDSDLPLREEDPLRPLHDYGRSKRDMEEVCQAQARALGVALCSMRIGNVAGADALLINAAALGPDEKLRLDCFKDGGTPLRSYIGPHSLARVMLSLIAQRTELPAALNIAAPDPVTMGALAQAAQAPVDLQPAQGQAHQHVTLACEALAALHPFDPVASQPAEMIRQWRMLARET